MRVLAGPARSGKTTRLLQQYREALKDAPPGSLLWLAPTALAARQLRRRLLDQQLAACFEPRIWTFDQFVHAVLDASGHTVRRISPLQSVAIIRHLLLQQGNKGNLRYLQAVVQSPGVASWVARFIHELKHHEIWPEHFRRACAASGRLSDKDHDIVLLYEQYQQFLLENQLYDPAGAYWQARTLLKQGQREPVASLLMLVVDGFTDFTRTQREILEELFARSREAWISLPLEPGSAREELFARSRSTWEQFLRPRGARLEELQAGQTDWPAMDFLQRRLFVPGAEPWSQQQAPAGVHLVAAPGATHEIQQVARQIKHLLVHGDPENGEPVSPGQVLVIARRAETLAELIAQEFAEVGVPVFLEAGVPLARAGLGQTLLQWLQLVESDGAFATVMALLGNHALRPADVEWNSEVAMTVRQAVRRCQVPRGLHRLLEAYAGLVKRHQSLLDAPEEKSGRQAEDDSLLQPERDWDARHLQMGHRVLQRWCETMAHWTELATLEQWRQRVEKTLRVLGVYPEDCAGEDGDASLEQSRYAWQALCGELLALERLLGQEASEPCSPQEFVATVRELLQQLTWRPACVPDACVRVVSAIHARGTSYPWVFVIGLSEESFPAPQDRPAVYSLAQRRRLQQRLPLPADADHYQGEMILFYEVLTRATRRLWLSYPALNEKAETLLPSPYLQEVQRLLALRPSAPEEQTLVQLPRDDRAANARQRWLLAADQARCGRVQWLRRVLDHDPPHVVQRLHRLWQCVRQRGRFGQFGPWEGWLELPSALEAVRRRWAQGATVSVTSLEDYASCPWRFLVQRLLRIQPLEEPAEELEGTRLGLLFHAVMARGHRQDPDLEQLAAMETGQFLQRWLPLVEAVLEEHFGPAADRPGVLGALATLAGEELRDMLAIYHRQLQEYLDRLRGAQWTQLPRPTHLELAFGLPGAKKGTAPPALSLTRGEDHLRLSGRVDRVDLGRLGRRKVAVVIDYKTGSPSRLPRPEGDVPDPAALQLDLYPAALEQGGLGGRVYVVESGFWSVRPRGESRGYLPWVPRYRVGSAGLEPEPQWQNRWERLQELVFRLWRGMRTGQFVVFAQDPRCTEHCSLARVCRIGHVRNLEKHWEPPSL